jgi:DNA-directed RNA polymerase subunit H (RpoH/RPB5)
MSSIMSDDTPVVDVFNARNHLFDILHTRGYEVDDYVGYDMSHVAAMMEQSQLNVMLQGKRNKVFVHFQLSAKLNVSKVVSSLFEEEESVLKPEDDLIIVYKAEPNDTVHAEMDEVWNKHGIYVSVLYIKRLQFNILKHDMVPAHRVLSEKEREQVFSKLNIKTGADLPAISRYDPVASVLCMRPGQVCEIERKSKTSVKSLYYRFCVK